MNKRIFNVTIIVPDVPVTLWEGGAADRLEAEREAWRIHVRTHGPKNTALGRAYVKELLNVNTCKCGGKAEYNIWTTIYGSHDSETFPVMECKKCGKTTWVGA